ncbi:ABC transporter permease [Geobacillus sp. C56-T2]|uniref:ABC transporter permease n=1 Tax=Geobacillus sp. C56-T2 TaxID=600773 RepID=UPI0011A34B60|nr:ABC transporter permease [Geobacillus sp. C56-T2]NNV06784.1 ABC transporter permease [Geobacillus sp. MMMUD3]TWG29578.1 ABC-2 type transport system permease protein [Geobacillus sp. C56-T2]
MNKFWLVMGHTYVTKLKAKAFLVTTALTCLLIIGLANVQTIIEAFTGDETAHVAVIDRTQSLYKALEKQVNNKEIALTKITDLEDEAKKAVKEGKWDGLLVLSTDEKGLPKAFYYANTIADNRTSEELERGVNALKTALAAAKIGLTKEQLAVLYQPVPFQKVALEKNAKSEEELNEARSLVYVLLFAMYMFVLMYGGMIATEVATEKSSRVMEILVSSIHPVQQLFGKIIGVALVSLTQFFVFFAVGFAALKASGQEVWRFLGLDQTPLSIWGYALIFFLLGYLLYAVLFAVLGSLVSRVEDVQPAITPVMLMVVAAFMIAMVGLNMPESPFVVGASFIPFFTPMLMFLRIGLVSVPAWEVALSLALLVATMALLILVGAKVYRGGVLMYGRMNVFKDMKQAIQLTKK